jgi:23S rRNA (pseudouridine1915-N3)-methyltransferase
MKLTLLCVGRAGRVLEGAIAEYESRVRRYFPLDVVEVKEERSGKGTTEAAVKEAEGERLLKRVPRGAEVVALTPTGASYGSVELARQLESHAVRAGGDLAYIIGGAFGLSDEVLRQARRKMQLSAFTMTHDLARLVLLEQLYRAGTIIRGEPYHKGSEGE